MSLKSNPRVTFHSMGEVSGLGPQYYTLPHTKVVGSVMKNIDIARFVACFTGGGHGDSIS